jgi:4-amino-4-deoxy-L-arabinose transferase-like glycosyltransferase
MGGHDVAVAPDVGVRTPPARARSIPESRTGLDRWWKLTVVVALLAGAAMRVGVLTGHLGGLDSDEAVVGLMAKDMLHGHFRAFYWGQEYAGTAETLVVAAVFAVTGATVVALKSVAVALSAVSCLLVWRVARRFVDERTAQVAALMFWLAPTPYIWFSTKTRGFYWAAMVAGLLILLMAARIAQDGGRRRDWCALGLAFGVGWWTSPTVVYFAAPAGLWLLLQPQVRRWSGVRRSAWGVPTAVLGAAPWLWHNFHSHLASLVQPDEPQHATYAEGLGRLLWRVTPMSLDLRRPLTAAWLPLGALVYLVVVAGIVAAVVRRRDRPVLILLAVAMFPWLYAVFPGRWFVGEGRYALFLAPVLFITLAWALRDRGPQITLLVVLAGLSALGLRDMGYDRPRHIDGDIAALEAAGINRVWSDYWLSYRLMFESHSAIVSTSEGYQRNIDYVIEVRTSDHPAFALPRTDGRVPALQAALADLGAGSRVIQTPHYNIVIADHVIDPHALPKHLRI